MSDKHNCKFCQKETVYVPLVIKGGNGDKSYHKFDVHYCYDCEAEYVHWGQINSVHLYTTVNNRMYRWSVELDGTMARLWYVGEPGEPGVRPNKKLKLVKNFKSIYPKITPQNVNEKLRFILLFL
jgi:hypothetical protein